MERKKITDLLKIENNKHIFTIILIGVVFMMFSFGGGEKKQKTIKSQPVNAISNEEKKLKEILSNIQGVGSVDVMITYYSTQKSNIAYETNSSNAERNDDDNFSSEQNSQKKAVMSDDMPFVMSQTFPDCKGVIIVCDGGGDILVKNQIKEAVTSVMGVASHKVCVAPKSKK